MTNKHRLPQCWVYLACLCVILGALGNTKAEEEDDSAEMPISGDDGDPDHSLQRSDIQDFLMQESESEKSTHEESSCGKNWISVPSQETCIWFSFPWQTKTWTKARDACKEIGGDLIKIDNSELEYEVVRIWVHDQKTFWIGLNDRVEENSFRWLDETEPAKFWDFKPGKPDQGWSNEDCVVLGAERDPLWEDVPCGRSGIRYICQAKKGKDLPPRPRQVCGKNWIKSDQFQTCIWFSHSFMKETWQGARKKCQEFGGDLLTIESTEFRNFVASLWQTTYIEEFWIGLNDIGTEGTFKWLRQTRKASFSEWYWYKGQLDQQKDSEDCVLVGYNQSPKWAAASCNSKKRFICQTQRVIDMPSRVYLYAFDVMMEQLPCKPQEEVNL